MKVLLVLGFTVVATCGVYKASAETKAQLQQAIPKDLQYRDARQRLFGMGYEPYRYQVSSSYKQKCDPGRNDVCGTYVEAIACSGTGLARCLFLFSKGPLDVVQVLTVGEEADKLHVENIDKMDPRSAKVVATQ